MRLAEFILGNIERILVEWEAFARGVWPPLALAGVQPAELRNDAERILRATVMDMRSDQSDAQRAEKSKGTSDEDAGDEPLNRASESHGVGRVGSGFDIWAVVAEYRALRASVLRLWRQSKPASDLHDVEDLTRFNESIDQSLTYAIRAYVRKVEGDRSALLASAQASRLEAETANRAKDQFLATLSHEMRTPLNAIVGWMRILRADGCNERDLEEGLDVIERNTNAQVQLIDDILDVSRIVSGKLRVEIRPCNLAEAINAGIDAVRPAALARAITLNVQLDPSAANGSCDTTRMQQVVWNLVSNAVKFTPKGGHVGVKLERHQSSTQISVSDDGEGISPEVLPYVFERFRQADSSARRKFAGLGLGLSIVKYLVEAHGGTIRVDSPGVGHGSTFTILLPIHAVRLDERPDALNATNPRRADEDNDVSLPPPLPLVRIDGLRVLVVDDEADARRLLVKVLEQAGAVVTAAASAREAMHTLVESQSKGTNEGAEVLVSDLGMPDEDGLDLIHQVRARGFHAKQLPAVALTAFVHKDDARKSLLAGFQVHLPKPVDPHDLTSVIASLAGRTR